MRFTIFVGRHNVDPLLLYDSYAVDSVAMLLYNISLKMNNDGGELTFTFPKNHYLWNSEYNSKENPLFTKPTDYVIVYKDNLWFWEGFLSDYYENMIGDYEVTISGALQYFKHIFCSLSTPVNIFREKSQTDDIYTPHKKPSATRWWTTAGTKPSFIKYCIFVCMNRIVAQYNERLNDLASEYNMNFNYQKIYVHPIESIIDVDSINVYGRYYQITNFENCYDALQNTITSSFGGRFYITKKTINLKEACDIYSYIDTDHGHFAEDLPTQDRKVTGEEPEKEVLLLNYTNKYEILSDNLVSLGDNLLEYNINEDFELYTSIIPLGDPYQEKTVTSGSPPNSRWWMKDYHGVYDAVEQKASLGWRKYIRINSTYGPGQKVYPYGGSRYFLPNIVSHSSDIVMKYGFREAVIEFSEIAIKYPSPINPATGKLYGGGITGTYGFPLGTTWVKGRDYKSGDCIWIKRAKQEQGKYNYFLNMCIQDHTATDDDSPIEGHVGANSHQYWEEIDTYERITKDEETEKKYGFIIAWKHYNMVLGIPNVSSRHWLTNGGVIEPTNYYIEDTAWDPYEEEVPCDHAYIQDYMAALEVLADDFLRNQQFDNLKLEISASLLSKQNQNGIDITTLLGNKLLVSADLFGTNIKPYEVSEVDLVISDINSSTIRLGGEQVNLTSLLRVKQK